MFESLRNEDLLELSALFVEKNKEFTDALKAGKSRTTLDVIYEDITALHDALIELKQTRLVH
jgi:hypothetical protein